MSGSDALTSTTSGPRAPAWKSAWAPSATPVTCTPSRPSASASISTPAVPGSATSSIGTEGAPGRAPPPGVARGWFTRVLRVESPEPTGDVVLGARVGRVREDAAGLVELHQAAVPLAALVHLGGEERGAVRDAGRLLHVVSDDHDGVVARQLLHQVL